MSTEPEVTGPSGTGEHPAAGARLVSVNVGMPKDISWQGRTVHTGIWKSPVEGPVMARRLNLDGDGQGDRAGHGGEQRAVYVYQVESLRYWQEHLGRSQIEFGQFGENFTVQGLADAGVCVGDRYRIGEAEFEVTQPRVTCFRLGIRMGEPTLPSLLVAHHRPGFYLRVITEGRVRAGDEIVLTRHGPHRMSVAEIDALLYLPHRTDAALRAAVDIPALSPGWVQSFRELLADGPAAEDQPAWPGFRELRVTAVVPESTTITSVYLAADDGTSAGRPQPGQYLTLRIPEAGRPAPVRNYSLSSSPDGGRYRISVKREGLVSTYLTARLKVGARVQAAAPRGQFVLTPGDEPVLLISAGVGVTPVLAMLHQLAGERAAREVWWLHAARDAAQQAFATEAHQLLESLPHPHEHVFHTAPAPGEEPARMTAATLAALGLPTEATAYVCGPAGFMADILQALSGLGVQRVNTELFGALAPINPGVTDVSQVPPHQPASFSTAAGTGPMVTFARSGLSTRWPQAAASLLELAEACDVPTRWSCRSGVCHTCVTPLLSGITRYQPEPLDEPSAGRILICCARPAGDVVLDL